MKNLTITAKNGNKLDARVAEDGDTIFLADRNNTHKKLRKNQIVFGYGCSTEIIGEVENEKAVFYGLDACKIIEKLGGSQDMIARFAKAFQNGESRRLEISCEIGESDHVEPMECKKIWPKK